MDWYPRNIPDYRDDTRHLSTLEHGAYTLLLDEYYFTRKPLPDHDQVLASIARMLVDDWLVIAPKIRKFFKAKKGLLHNKRANAELDRQDGRRKIRTAKAEKAAAARWGKAERTTRGERLSRAREKGTHTEREWEALVAVFDNSCVRCGVGGSDLHGGRPCKDHIVQIYQGGSDAIANIQPMCRNCNSGKGTEQTDYRPIRKPNWLELFTALCGMPAMGSHLAGISETPAERLLGDATGTGTETLPSREEKIQGRETLSGGESTALTVINGGRE